MQFALMGSVLLMGFLGSWHCGVMCGPLSCNFKKNEDFISYQMGRLISYLVMGSLLFLGAHYFLNTESRALKIVSSIVFGLIFIFFGLIQMNIFNFKNTQFKYYKLQFKILNRFRSISNRFPVVLGLLTGFFPCTWLYSFLILSSQMRTLAESLLVIFLFWLSALPAFVLLTGFMKKLIKASPMSYQKISGFVLIGAGVLAIFGQWANFLY